MSLQSFLGEFYDENFRLVLDRNTKTEEDFKNAKHKPRKLVCEICDREYWSNGSRSKQCLCCHIEFRCKVCNQWILVRARDATKSQHLCRKCSQQINLLSEESRRKNYENKLKSGFYDKLITAGHTKEACIRQYETRKKNGNLPDLHSHKVRMKAKDTAIKNGSFQRWLDSLNSSESHQKSLKTRKESGSFDEFLTYNARFYDMTKDVECNPNCKAFDTCTNKYILKNEWGWCRNSLNLIHPPEGFNRKAFYSKHVKLTTYSSVDELLEDFDKLEGVPGIIDVGFHDGDKWISLDVGQSIDLKQECLGYLRRLEFNKGLTDEELSKENERYQYNRKKYRDMMAEAGEHKIEFMLVVRDIETQKKREDIEAQHAHDVKSMFWSPAPGQII